MRIMIVTVVIYLIYYILLLRAEGHHLGLWKRNPHSRRLHLGSHFSLARLWSGNDPPKRWLVFGPGPAVL